MTTIGPIIKILNLFLCCAFNEAIPLGNYCFLYWNLIGPFRAIEGCNLYFVQQAQDLIPIKYLESNNGSTLFDFVI